WEKIDPQIVAVTPRRPVVGKFEKFEVDVKFKASFASYFDPNELSIAATFTAPNGDRFVAYGFLAGFSESEEGESRPEWLIRFAPNQIGRWEYKVSVRNKIGEDISETLYFDCRQNESSRSVVKRGFVRRARSDSLYFEFDNGDFYYPIGQNVCWAARYDDFLAKMSSHGENWVRVWMCPWHLPLEEKDDAGNYDLAVAKKLDDLLSLAEKHGIYVQLVFEYHGMAASSGSWAENPYNQTNGGPCLAPGDFFEDAKARELFKRRLRYIAARWGYSTQVFAWELWNEVDLTEYREWDHVVAWHREMAGYLKAVDAQKHLVTTSCYKDEPGDALYALPQIDLAQAHRYTPQVTDFIVSVTQRVRKFNKPFFVAEFGRGWTPEVDQKDPTGAHLHAGLWSSFMTPAAGSAMLWWWDTFVEHNNLYPQWKALAAF
ncbi:MAG: DUF5060 domain-containing protein, partial [Planctomycetes bacterium]|nr:DUF5060 domain-containing protein [Planctomycetota bacterium]